MTFQIVDIVSAALTQPPPNNMKLRLAYDKEIPRMIPLSRTQSLNSSDDGMSDDDESVSYGSVFEGDDCISVPSTPVRRMETLPSPPPLRRYNFEEVEDSLLDDDDEDLPFLPDLEGVEKMKVVEDVPLLSFRGEQKTCRDVEFDRMGIFRSCGAAERELQMQMGIGRAREISSSSFYDDEEEEEVVVEMASEMTMEAMQEKYSKQSCMVLSIGRSESIIDLCDLEELEEVQVMRGQDVTIDVGSKVDGLYKNDRGGNCGAFVHADGELNVFEVSHIETHTKKESMKAHSIVAW
mmetsp:Transcript_7828/g.12060  ORF Transcript_7828/g.12060 Transcript_7828/m.12060 type:complete len:294 (-) Transcript_7828:183-1064(-)